MRHLLTFGLALVVAACGRSDLCLDATQDFLVDAPGELNTMSDADHISGLWTSPADTAPPVGALLTADNTAFYQSGQLDPRRGFELLSTTSIGGTINRMTEYQGYVIAHFGSGSIARWTGSAWSTYSGTFNPPASGVRVKFFEAESSLYVLTSVGMYELDSPTGTWRLAGAPAGLQGTATLTRTTNAAGTLASANGQWAYRLVWGYRNANNRLQLSAPSGRFLLTSPANVVATVANISKTSGTAVVTVVNTTHGFATGEYVDVTLGGVETNFVAGRFAVTVVSATSFTYNDGGAAAFSGTPAANITYGFTIRNAVVSAPVPAGITTSNFLQVYRSAKSADANTEASDSMGLVYERCPTNLEITAGVMSITDIVPDEIRGTELYTSIQSLLRAKAVPPAAKDATTYREVTFCGDCASAQALDLFLMGAGGDAGIQNSDFVILRVPTSVLGAGWWGVALQGSTSGETLTAGVFQIFTAGSAAQNLANTARSLVKACNAYTSNTKLYCEYVSTDNEAPGHVRFYARDPTIAEFTVVVESSLTVPTYLTPVAPRRVGVTSMARVGSTVSVTTSAAHGYAVGQEVTLERTTSGVETTFPDGVKTVATAPTSTTFTFTEAGSAVSAADAYVLFAAPITIIGSDAHAVTNSIRWSDPGEPGSFPLVNYDTVGPSGASIYGFESTQDRVIVHTDKGAYQITGNGRNFSVSEFDVTLKAAGRRLHAIGSGKGYVLADQGFAELGESARIVSLPIDRTLRGLLTSVTSDVAAYGFAVANDGDGLVYFFLPSAAGDTSAKQVYVYHVASKQFTRWELTGGDGTGPVAQDAFVSPTSGKLYIASGGYVVKERKSLVGVADQLDPIIPGTKSTTVSALVGSTFTPVAYGTNYWQAGTLVRNVTRSLNSAIVSYAPGSGAGGAGGVVTVASTATWADGDTIYPTAGPVGGANGSTVEIVPMTEDDPGAQKVWKLGSLGFRDSRFASATLKFSTDLSPTYSAATTLAPPGGSTSEPTAIDFWVAQSWMRGSRLKWKFNHATSSERYTLQSWTVRGRVCSPATSK